MGDPVGFHCCLKISVSVFASVAAPKNVAAINNEMTFAPGRSPHRGQQCYLTTSMRLYAPTRRRVSDEAEMNGFSAAARANENRSPLALIIANDVNSIAHQTLRHRFDTRALEACRFPSGAAKELGKPVAKNRSHFVNGLSSSGVQSPRPTRLRRTSQVGPSESFNQVPSLKEKSW